MSKIEVERDQLEELIRQNKEMKEIMKEAYTGFKNIKSVVNLPKTANIGMLTLTLPGIIKAVQKNPQLFSFLNNDFLNKIEKYASASN